MCEQDAAFAAIAHRLVPRGRLTGSRPLRGGVSATMHVLEVLGPDRRTRRLVVRRHGAARWKPLAADVTATEYALLEALVARRMPVPEPLLLDATRELLPTPYFVMAHVAGTTTPGCRLPDALRRMAAFLAQLHALDLAEVHLPTLPEREDPREALSDYLPSGRLGERLRRALEGMAPVAPAPRRSLLHGDFWPENVIWQDGEIAAVVDWEDAALGDPLSDLACSRVELLCRYDEAAMDTFTAHYRELTSADLGGLPLWEAYVSAAALATLADWGLEPAVEADRRRRTAASFERAAQELLTPP